MTTYSSRHFRSERITRSLLVSVNDFFSSDFQSIPNLSPIKFNRYDFEHWLHYRNRGFSDRLFRTFHQPSDPALIWSYKNRISHLKERVRVTGYVGNKIKNLRIESRWITDFEESIIFFTGPWLQITKWKSYNWGRG